MAFLTVFTPAYNRAHTYSGPMRVCAGRSVRTFYG